MHCQTNLSQFPLRSILNTARTCKPYQRKIILQVIFLALTIIPFAVSCTNPSNVSSSSESSPKTESLEIWWDKGFNPEEDEALRQLIDDWEQQTGHKIELSFYTTDKLAHKTQQALRGDNPPDIIMSFKAERSLNARLAWEGKLADVTDVIKPVEHLYPQAVLETVHYYNKEAEKRSYYGVPIHQATILVFYWQDLLEQAGRTKDDIPKDWEAFWNFWKQVQDNLSPQMEIYGLGFPMSVEAADTHFMFEQVLEAYDVQLLDPAGNLLVNEPQVRQGIVKSLDWYAQFYQQDYVPPTALHWLNPGNNRSLLNRRAVMTPNDTLSIPGAVRQDPDTYQNRLGILEFPNKPSGKPMRYLITVEQAIVLAKSQRQELAKAFLSYMLQPEIMGKYLKAAGGRNAPAIAPLWNDPFWSDPGDPHISTATKVLTEGQTRSFYIAQNPAYSNVLRENVWGKALKRIVRDEIAPEQAADEAIARIEEIFAEWERS